MDEKQERESEYKTRKIVGLMKGNLKIIDAFIKNSNGRFTQDCFKNLDDITYEIINFGEDKTYIKVKFNKDYICPVYYVFDGYHFCWYGDYGSLAFDCTWKTNLFNMPYDNPCYMAEKCDDSEKIHTWDSAVCLDEIKRCYTDWADDNLTEEQKVEADKWVAYEYRATYNLPEILEEWRDNFKELYETLNSTDEHTCWIQRCSEMTEDDPIFYAESAYYFGKCLSSRFFIMFYILSVVKEMEEEFQN